MGKDGPGRVNPLQRQSAVHCAEREAMSVSPTLRRVLPRWSFPEFSWSPFISGQVTAKEKGAD